MKAKIKLQIENVFFNTFLKFNSEVTLGTLVMVHQGGNIFYNDYYIINENGIKVLSTEIKRELGYIQLKDIVTKI